jgi:hypothetical protein
VVARDNVHKGKFLMVIGLGTPPAVFNLVTIDTGSTLSWVQCQPCQILCSSRDCADVHEFLGIPFGCVEETDTASIASATGPVRWRRTP